MIKPVLKTFADVTKIAVQVELEDNGQFLEWIEQLSVCVVTDNHIPNAVREFAATTIAAIGHNPTLQPATKQYLRIVALLMYAEHRNYTGQYDESLAATVFDTIRELAAATGIV